MVHIIDFAEREDSAGETFYSLILQGGVEMVMSQEIKPKIRWNHYDMSKKSTTMNLATSV